MKLGIKKIVIQPTNKEKILKEEIKKKPFYMVDNESRFKSKLKENIKKEYPTKQILTQRDEEHHSKPIFKPR
ncbi:hypothetical protein ACJ8BK_06940 [Klebsiella pneumoniae]